MGETKRMNNIYDDNHARLYDLVVEFYFDYKKSTEALLEITKGKTNITEIGVGTGNIAIPLAEARKINLNVFDSSNGMLNVFKGKINPINKYILEIGVYDVETATLKNGSNISFFNYSFEDLVTERIKTQAIYSHSGPLTAYTTKDGLKIIADSEQNFHKIIHTASEILDKNGILIINIEEPISREFKVRNGTYIKTVHRFDNIFHRTYTYSPENQPTFSFELESPVMDIKTYVLPHLKKAGFDNFKEDLDKGFFWAEKTSS